MSAWKQRLALPRYIARHPANRGRVVGALGRAVAFQVRARVTRRPITTQIGTMRMWVHIGNAAATKVVYGSPPDWPEMQTWARLLSTGDLFIDVGANVGTYALWATSVGAQAVAIEPDPDTAIKLRANVELNPGAPITVVEAALTDHEGTVEITAGLDTLNRIGRGRPVRATTLDAIAGDREVRGVKIDVEGHERSVLDGAGRLLSDRRVSVWQLEWNGASVEALDEDREPVAVILRDAGYVLARPDDNGELHPEMSTAYGADMFAIHPDLFEKLS